MLWFKGRQPGKRTADDSRTASINPDGRRMSYQVGNLQSVGARDRQEDSFAFINALDVTEIIKNGLLAVVADGMGGMDDGKLASETAVSCFVNAFHSLDRAGDIPSQLYDSVQRTNRSLYEKFKGSSGTTVVLVMIFNSEAYWVSVGDSSIYLKRSGGLYKLNQDQTYLNELYLEELYRDEIDKEMAESNEDKARLSEFLGKDTISKVDYNRKPLRLRVGDTILLCSDGISGFLDGKAISAALEFPPSEACDHLNNLIRQQAHPRQDNYTGLIISVQN